MNVLVKRCLTLKSTFSFMYFWIATTKGLPVKRRAP